MPTWIGTRELVLRVGTTDFSDSVSKCTIDTDDDSDAFASFLVARSGGPKKWVLKGTLRQDVSATSLWYYMWGTNRGASVAVEFWPKGRPVSGTASTTQPKWSGNVIIALPTGTLLGTEADPSPNKAATADFEWIFEAEPTLTTA